MRLERILVLGVTPLTEQILAETALARLPRHVVVGVLDDAEPAPEARARSLYRGRVGRLPQLVGQLRPQRIVVGLKERRGSVPVGALLEAHLSRGIAVEDAAEFYERLTGKLAIEALAPMQAMVSGQFRPSSLPQTVIHVLSAAAAAAALVALAPLLGLIALAIRIDSPGPVLFTQRRVGAGGRPFTLLKFRTMRCDRPAPSEWEADNRDRVTAVGARLRAFRLDELPQLVNILRGEMNLVGPRPHPVTNLELFTLVARNLNERTGAAVGCYALRLMVRPGLTGWAQIRYRYANNLDEEMEKLRYDLYYVKHRSLWLDLRILLETLSVVAHGRVATTAPACVAQPAVRPVAVSLARPLGLTRHVGDVM